MRLPSDHRNLLDPNATTAHTADVGNVCVKRFLGLPSDKIFRSLKVIRRDGTKSVGAAAAAFFYERRIISKWEFDFLQDTFRKKNLTVKQLLKRADINAKINKSVQRRGV